MTAEMWLPLLQPFATQWGVPVDAISSLMGIIFAVILTVFLSISYDKEKSHGLVIYLGSCLLFTFMGLINWIIMIIMLITVSAVFWREHHG